MQTAPSTQTADRLEAIFKQDYAKLYGLVYRITEDHPHTEDVLQNTFIKAYRGIDGFKEQSRLSTWVCRIAINESYRHMKSWHKLPVVQIAENLGVCENAFFASLETDALLHDNLIMDELREKCLRGFLRCVPKNMRVCFLLKTCMGLSTKEIAHVMNISEANAKTTLFRARKRLKEMFNERCSLIDPNKPCKCYLWVKYMNDNGYPLPSGHDQYKNEALKQQHFKNMSLLKKINYLYRVDAKITQTEFFDHLKKITPTL